MLKIGTFLIEGLGGRPSEIYETARLVEEVGLDGLFVGENHFPEEGVPPEKQGAWGLTSAPLMLCMAIAANTKRLRIGTSVLALPLHHAMEVAKQAAAIDALSEGRMVLGIGIGMEANGFAEYGIPYTHRFSLLEEGVELIRRAWTEERFTCLGRRYNVRNGSLNLRPFNSFSIPLWVAARTEGGAKRAGRIGDAIVIDAATTLEETKAVVNTYRQICEKRNRQPYVVLMRDICIGTSAADARRKYEEGVIDRFRLYWSWKYLNATYDPWITQIDNAAEVTWELTTKDRMIVGSSEDSLNEIRKWKQEIGCDYMMLEFLMPSGGRNQVLEDIRQFGRSVLPRIDC